MNKIRILLRTSDNYKIGGVRQIYRHVDVLNQIGYDAAVIHPTKFRCTWFENNTKTISFDELSLDKEDYFVIPEQDQGVPEFPGSDVCKVVIFAQNPYGFLKGFGGPDNLFNFYKTRVSSVICVSEHSRIHLQELLPDLRVHRIKYSFDKGPFGFGENKEKIISFMPRRRNQEMFMIFQILRRLGCLDGWNIIPIDHMDEKEVADVMRRSSVFMAGGQLEGFGMPVAEAMLSGCMVVGWHGYGGEEVFKSDFSLSVPDGDVLAYVRAMKQVLSLDISKINKIGKKASDFIKKEYSTNLEIESIKSAWMCIIDKDKENNNMNNGSVFPLNDVAAYIMANEENAYIERIVRWLSVRVGKVFIIEGEKSYSGSSDRDMCVENLVKKLVNSGITNIKHCVVKYRGYGNPAVDETYMRNEALDIIQRQGFEWIWIVDSDEVYTDKQADDLWKWFLGSCKDDNIITGAKCSMYTYWRSLHYRIDPPEPLKPNIILRSDRRFSLVRDLSDTTGIIEVPKEVCMMRHYSWAKSPADIKKKIEGWGHAHQMLPGWYEDVFEKWIPGCNMINLHPTQPSAYFRAVNCQLPLPEIMKDHPYLDLDFIDCDDHSSAHIKVIILNHNKPENSDKLFEQLSKAFSDVEIWDSGSDPDKIPINVTKSFPNFYWTGAWNEAMRLYSGGSYDVVWIVGCDIELKSEPIDYLTAIQSSLPFGCWSPCVDGRAQPFMQASNYSHGKPVSVRNIEGISMALSCNLMGKIGCLVEGSEIGYGQDFFMCYESRKEGLKNIIDGRVKIFHPESRGYDDVLAQKQMNNAFSSMYGEDFRKTIFEYKEGYEENIMPEDAVVKKEVLIPQVLSNKKFTIVTVDNGWGYSEFLRIVSKFPQARKIIMVKGVAELVPEDGIEIIKYDSELKGLIDKADMALFAKVGAANKEEYLKLIQAGIPTVVHVSYHMGIIDHMKNGFYYQDEQWAIHWIGELLSNISLRKSVNSVLKSKLVTFPDVIPATGCSSCAEKAKQLTSVSPLVTVITPTYHRDPKTIKRCIDCMKLQTMTSWEQLVCSDGEEEPHVKKIVDDESDPRIIYCHTNTKKQGDFGNTVRSEMLKRARGGFVLFFDDDNIILPSYLAQMMKAITVSGNAEFAVCKIMHFGPLNEKTGKPPVVLMGDPIKLYHIDPLQVLVKTEVIKKVGWDTEVGYLSDGVTLEKLGSSYKHTRVEEVLGIHV